MTNKSLNLAGQGRRLINVIVDTITYLILWLILSFVLFIFGLDYTYTDETQAQIPLIPMVIIIPTFWGYYLLTEYFFHQTVGKMLTKTKVVTKTGDNPTFGQIIGRTLSRSIPFEYLSYLIGVKGIHDYLSGTRVIKLKNAS